MTLQQSELTGMSASRGIAIGNAYFLDRDCVIPTKVSIKDSDIDGEIRRFKKAVRDSIVEMKGMRSQASEVLGEKHLYLFDTYVLLLEDDLLVEDTIGTIKREKVNAEWSFHVSVEKCIELFMKTGNWYIRERKNDIEQVKNNVLLNLAGQRQESLTSINGPVIVIARDLQPSDLVQMNKSKILGFITEVGGKVSHVGIMASALEIPAVVGLSIQEIGVKNGEAIILDGFVGRVYVNPSPGVLETFIKKQQRVASYKKNLLKDRSLLSETKDGVHIKLAANIEYSDGMEIIRNSGAEGIGLFRTEYLFMNRDDLPGEEEQYREYKKVATYLNPDPVIIRTMDIGGDKPSKNISMEEERNPALGLRAIRLSFKKPDIFKVQLRAILRAGYYGKVKLMFPMISGVDELRKAKHILEEVKKELKEEGVPFNQDIPVGIMIETPSSVSIADILAKEVDFFSIGTNDLIQYALAVDRGNKNVAYLYTPLHPAILRMIADTIRAANRAGIEVGICGEMGGNAAYIMILLGLGKINEISMDSHSIPKVKKMIRSITVEESIEFTKQVMSLGASEEIEKLVHRVMMEKFPNDFMDESFAGRIN